MLAIRLFPNGNYDIYFKYFEESKEEYLEVSKTLSAEEIEKLPKGIKWVLEETIKAGNWQGLDPKRLNQ